LFRILDKEGIRNLTNDELANRMLVRAAAAVIRWKQISDRSARRNYIIIY